MEQIKIPYGLSGFREIRQQKYLYVDKTKYIETLEQLPTKYPVFLRPRRFGKTLLASTLFAYYDRNSADQFESLFGDLYIGSHKTALANQYYVLRFEFTGLNAENEEQLQQAFNRKVIRALKKFIYHYQLEIEIGEEAQFDAAGGLDAFLTDLMPLTGQKVYVIVDEYDHFANDIIDNQEFFGRITSTDGFVRRFYEVFKAHTGDGCIDRIFITGVTSMTLDSLTSGFNIARNVSMLAQLNEMVGFTELETQDILALMGFENADNIMDLLVNQYNGYRFHSGEEVPSRVLNSNLVLYFLSEYQMRGTIPTSLIDSNIRTDYQKLTELFSLFTNEESRTEIIQTIMDGKSVATDIVTNFSYTSGISRDEFLSMLFYLGLLTIKGPGGSYDVILEPPNAVIRDVYYKYYSDYLQIDGVKKRTALDEIAEADDFSGLQEMITKVLQKHSNTDFQRFNEARLKSIFLACLSDQNRYLVKSEYESSGRRIDIALIDPRDGATSVKYNYLIELKYLKNEDASEGRIKAVREEARKQMKEYLQLEEFRNDERLKGMICVVAKDVIHYFEEVR